MEKAHPVRGGPFFICALSAILSPHSPPRQSPLARLSPITDSALTGRLSLSSASVAIGEPFP